MDLVNTGPIDRHARSKRTETPALDFEPQQTAPQGPDGQRFTERRRIALMESDLKLRAVIIHNLVRRGCVVSTKRNREQILDALATEPIDGAIISLEADAGIAAALSEANRQHAVIVILTDLPVEPRLKEQFATLFFLQKPFDMRELLSHLRLPQQALITRDSD